MSSYKVIRFYADSAFEREVLETGLSFEEAQAICNDPETSSRTATSLEAQDITDLFGPWFVGYEEE